MILRVPSYYKTFQCIADKCEHSCCIGWEIDIDEDSYDYYMGIEGAFGERLKEQTVTEDGEHSFVLRKNGWCPFLDQNKLCDIYSELGEEALCEVCTEYPRFVVEYGDVREKSLSVSCEEVGRIIFSDEGKMSYEDIELPDLGIEDEFYEDEEEEPFEEDMEEFCSHLEEYRTQAVAILQNREKSIDDRIREYLKFCEKLQNVVENPEEELWEPMEYFHVRMETFDELENVNEEWMEVKQRVRDFFETHSYTEALEEYKKDFDSEWQDEKYKWQAVKCFQDNWDVNAADFADMLTRSLAKTYNLLVSMNNFPGKMIEGFAKAAPEDLQKIVASWKIIIGQTTGMFKQMLQKSIPKYNGETGSPVLYVEFQDFLGKTYVDNPEAEEELKRIIAAQTGKEVELKMLVAREHNQTNLAQVTVDQAIRENIHMDVVIEEDPDDID